MRHASRYQKARRSVGDATESAISFLLNVAHARGIAWAVKIPTAYVVGKNRSGMFWYPEEKRSVDFMGHIVGGPGLYIEAKSTSEKSLYASAVTTHQREVLGRASAAGQMALLAVIWTSTPTGKDPVEVFEWEPSFPVRQGTGKPLLDVLEDAWVRAGKARSSV